jgi:hypothetical protein
MAYKIGIAGAPNTGKSFSRRTIPDGENVMIIAPSLKASHLTTTAGAPIQPFDIKTAKYTSFAHAIAETKQVNRNFLFKQWNDKLPPGTFHPENILGNYIQIEKVEEIPFVTEFISKHLPWIHTAIFPDFTHFVSTEISEDAFINRKAGGEAFQKFWELAAKLLRKFITEMDKYRRDLLIITEYHAHRDEHNEWEIFVPAGKMLTEKFLPTSYYDILVYTDVKYPEDETDGAEYRFVTRPTRSYPSARTMNLYEDTFVDNDLQELMTRVRKKLGIEWKTK